MKEFFEALYAPIRETHPDYKLLTMEIQHGAKYPKNGALVSPFNSTEIQAVVDLAVERKHSVYFHMAMGLNKEYGEKIPVKLKKEHMEGSCFLWVEIDDKDEILSEQRLAEIMEDEYKPNVIVRSGNGWHMYFLLSAYETSNDVIEACNRFLIERFGGDHCYDINRVLRIPNSFNFKDVNNPKDVSIYWMDTSFRRPIGDYPKVESLPEKAKLAAVNRINLDDSFLEDKRFDGHKWVIEKMFEELEGPTEANGFQGNRSGRDYQVANKLSQLGFTGDEVYSVLTHDRWPIGDKGRENLSYAKSTAIKVTSRTDSFDMMADSIEKAFTSNNDSVPVTVASKIAEPSQKSGKNLAFEIRSIFSEVLQSGGTMRPYGSYPKFGAVFGERVALAIHNAGYRYVYDPEYDLSFISNRKGKVWEAHKGGEDFDEFISGVSGFGTNQEEFKFISAGVIRYIKHHGEQIKIGRWVHYDHELGKYYILADSFTGKMFIISEDGSMEVSYNGVGDVFLRPRTQSSKPLELTDGVNTGDAIAKLNSMFTDFIAGPESTRKFTRAFLLAITMCYGSDRIGTLPILHMTGPSGGGKSSTIGCMTSYLFGYVQVLLYTMAAAYRVSPNEVFMAHDDKEDVSKDMENFFLLASTRVVRTMCDAGNQRDVATQKAHVVNGITSIDQLKTTALRRRAFVVEIDKDKYPSIDVLTEDDALDLAYARDYIWSGMVPIFSKMISNFRDGTHRKLTRTIYNAIEIDEFKGLSAFLALMVLVEKEICKHTNADFDQDETILSFIRAASMEDSDEILGRDPLVLCLEAFFEQFFSTQSNEVYAVSDITEDDYKVPINRTLRKLQWELTTDEENDIITEKLGYNVRGIKASATGWVSIFSADTREYARTINSPTSLGKQFSRVEKRETDFPFYITWKRNGKSGKIWSVFQKI